MLESAVILFWVLLGAAFVYWSRSPYHHRGIRQTELADFATSLLRDADGSRMVVEDESTLRVIRVEKWDSSEGEVSFLLSFAEEPGEAEGLGRALQERNIEAAVESDGSETRLTIRCRKSTDGAEVSLLLRLVLEALGSNVTNSYHIYFEGKPDPQASREHFEHVLDDPDASSFRKEVARRALQKLDDQLVKKQT